MPGDDFGGFERFLRVGEGRRLKRLRNQAEYIGTLEPELEGLSDEELKGKTAEERRGTRGHPLRGVRHGA
jgi:preprotein translocase subunit SecA